MEKHKDLEEAVLPIVEETVEQKVGVHIPKLESDIADQILNHQLDIYIAFDLPFKDAKKKFKKEFLKRELDLHLGNVSALAKVLDVDRRSIHRAIKELDIDLEVMRTHKPRQYTDIIDKTIRHTLERYEGVIHPEKMHDLYQEVPALSRNIAQVLPHPEMTWKQAEEEFERMFFRHALQGRETLTQVAKRLGVRLETLVRKLKKLGIGRK